MILYDWNNNWATDLWLLRSQNTPQIFFSLFPTTNAAKLESIWNQHPLQMKRYNHKHTPRYEFLWYLRLQKWIWNYQYYSKVPTKYQQSTSKVSKVSVLNATLNSQSYPKRITSCSGWFSFETSVNSFARRLSGVEFLLPISTDSLDSKFSNMTQLTTSREVRVIFSCH